MTYRGHSVLQTLIHLSPPLDSATSTQGRFVVYDILTGKIKAILRGHKGCVRDVAWHPYRNEIMSSSWDGTVVKWTFNKTDSEDIMPGQSSKVDGLRRSQRLADKRRETRLFSPIVL
ncbi:DDB1- and CUL4-associated factor 11-like [Parasteatoda tepidariorum]|uniref:DDB1- and CUL4-associated factor 11-like n=1 Tax=Parasteatoda tepidariorum TaxID=114398 RepID=UPI001C71A2AF|nr:DDB1- and CUL4-associated factor 11-like [Parasteatoda tepidariorum]